MPKLIIITKLLTLAGVQILGISVGTLAYYHQGDLYNVCLLRDSNGWNQQLNCSFPCLISAIEQEHIGEYWLIALPNCNGHERFLRLCHVVDVGAVSDLPQLRERNEVVEISNGLAQYCGYETYVDDVWVWRLGGY